MDAVQLIFVIVLAVLILAGGGLYFANDYFMLGLEKIPQKLGLVEEIVPDETTGETALPAAEATTGGSTADTPAAEPTAQPAQTPAPGALAASRGRGLVDIFPLQTRPPCAARTTR